jgi:hypothetical protein
MTVVLSVALLGESLGPVGLAGIAAVLLGVVLIARGTAAGSRLAKDPWGGILATSIAFVLFGFYYFGLAYVIGPVPPGHRCCAHPVGRRGHGRGRRRVPPRSAPPSSGDANAGRYLPGARQPLPCRLQCGMGRRPFDVGSGHGQRTLRRCDACVGGRRPQGPSKPIAVGGGVPHLHRNSDPVARRRVRTGGPRGPDGAPVGDCGGTKVAKFEGQLPSTPPPAGTHGPTAREGSGGASGYTPQPGDPFRIEGSCHVGLGQPVAGSSVGPTGRRTNLSAMHPPDS